MDIGSILFDLDGTLWDATPSTAKGWNEALQLLGADERVTVDDIRRVTGNPQTTCIDTLLPGLSGKYRDFYELLTSYESETLRRDGGALYDGVLETLPLLAERFPLFVVSNCEDWYLDLFFRKYDVKKYFRDTDCFGKSRRPKSEMIKRLTAHYDLKTPVYIGDTSSDQKASQDAGVEFIFSSYGFGTVENPEHSVKTFREIPGIFTKNPA